MVASRSPVKHTLIYFEDLVCIRVLRNFGRYPYLVSFLKSVFLSEPHENQSSWSVKVRSHLGHLQIEKFSWGIWILKTQKSSIQSLHIVETDWDHCAIKT